MSQLRQSVAVVPSHVRQEVSHSIDWRAITFTEGRAKVEVPLGAGGLAPGGRYVCVFHLCIRAIA